MAKVLLIQPNYDIATPYRWKSEAWMPLALVSLATYIKEKQGHEVRILDRNLQYDNNQFIKLLNSFNPDIVGLTCYTSPAIKDIMQVSKITKENSKAIVVVGGPHATLEPKSLLDYPYIDYVVRGEGEQPLLEICDLVDKKKATKKNISKLKNVNYNEMRPFINLNDVPIMDYDLIEVKKYAVTTFATSRGCPGRCRFCYNQGRQLRFYDTAKTIEMMTRVIEKYKTKEFTIADDNFANMSKRTTDICSALSKYNCSFFCFLRTDQVYDKVMSELKKAGCLTIQFGFESGSQRILNFIRKDNTVEQNAKAVQQCRKYGIFVEGSFMIGLPTETISDLKQTLNFISKNKMSNVFTKIYKPYPSTELYDYCIKNKLMKKPETLEEWIEFSNLSEGNINVSPIPTPVLLKAWKLANKHTFLDFLQKGMMMVKKGHINHAVTRFKQLFIDRILRRI
jgi:radical SAM superfamily enzyme YgiQ (UPF0313 family)